jgi:hypothetical protein
MNITKAALIVGGLMLAAPVHAQTYPYGSQQAAPRYNPFNNQWQTTYPNE